MINDVHQVMAQGLTRRTFQSACLLVALDGQPVLHSAYGPARLDTLFDLASLTKPLATVASLMRCVAEGRLRLDLPLGHYLPAAMGQPVGACTLTQLLAHTAGLPAWSEGYRASNPQRISAASRRRLLTDVASQPLIYTPGSRVLYSDLGYILLGWLLEQVGGMPLDRLAATLVYAPLALKRTLFAPAVFKRWRQQRILVAPTEICPWRKRRLVAEVHDENAHALGGVAGHAGLFSTAYDIHQITEQLVAAYHGQQSLFDPRVVQRFFHARPVQGATWALGWDRPAVRAPRCGRHFGPLTVGHLGFTGTSLWIDLPRRLWIILLTNRVYYGRTPLPMRRFRPLLHNRVLRALQER